MADTIPAGSCAAISSTKARRSVSTPGSSSSRSVSRVTHCASSAALVRSSSAPVACVSWSCISARRCSASFVLSGSLRPSSRANPFLAAPHASVTAAVTTVFPASAASAIRAASKGIPTTPSIAT